MTETPSLPSHSKFAVIGYLPDYETPQPEWGHFLTDIIYFSAEPLPEGSLDTHLLKEDTWRALQAMKSRFGTRLFLSIGGWERSDGFVPMVAGATTRRAFVANLLSFSLDHDLDGVDFDWEFPENDAQSKGYFTLLDEVHQAFAAHQMTVSVTLTASPDQVSPSFSAADRIQVMSYDHHPQHATYQQALDDLTLFQDGGIDKRQLILGIPFYGRSITDFQKSFTYQEIVNLYHPAPDQDIAGDIYFNNLQTIRKKTCYAYENGFAGVMIWELGQDTTDSTSLLSAIHQAVLSGCHP